MGARRALPLRAGTVLVVGGALSTLVLLSCLRAPTRSSGSQPERASASTGALQASGGSAPALTRADSPPLRAGPLLAERSAFRFILFHLPRPSSPVLPRLAELTRQRFKALRLVGEGQQAGPGVVVRATQQAASEYPLPDDELLEYAARKLAPKDMAGLAASERITLLEFTSAPPSLQAVRQAHALALELARHTGALLLDEESGDFYSADTWQRERLSSWQGEQPLLQEHLSFRIYEDELDTAQLTTVGLGKFGLPDLTVRHVPDTVVRNTGTLLNLVAQLLLEGTPVRGDGYFPVAIDSLKSAPVRAHFEQGLMGNAHRRTVVRLRLAEPDEAEQGNRLVELDFPESPGEEASERLYSALAELLGSSDEVVSVQHGEELMETSRRAVERLVSSIKPRFQEEGLKEGERLFVKAPFETTEGGNEWMWVRVSRWEGRTLHGVLDSEPQSVPSLRAGASVSVDESSLFDYILVRPDGTVEGNETQRFLR